MITKFNLYNESLRDQMKPKSKEELKKSMKDVVEYILWSDDNMGTVTNLYDDIYENDGEYSYRDLLEIIIQEIDEKEMKRIVEILIKKQLDIDD